jgi:hypothetical protein
MDGRRKDRGGRCGVRVVGSDLWTLRGLDSELWPSGFRGVERTSTREIVATFGMLNDIRFVQRTMGILMRKAHEEDQSWGFKARASQQAP